jgi:hypothetical protein
LLSVILGLRVIRGTEHCRCRGHHEDDLALPVETTGRSRTNGKDDSERLADGVGFEPTMGF